MLSRQQWEHPDEDYPYRWRKRRDRSIDKKRISNKQKDKPKNNESKVDSQTNLPDTYKDSMSRSAASVLYELLRIQAHDSIDHCSTIIIIGSELVEGRLKLLRKPQSIFSSNISPFLPT